ncbi:hypothetical protein EIP86_009246 [Pleurotus ostreatoroseus]|nr:hypothetical protein EIP86_009246 [Pleurotus ostreatoroseus]
MGFSSYIREFWILGPLHGPTTNVPAQTLARLLAAFPNLHTLRLVRVSLAAAIRDVGGGSEAQVARKIPRHAYKLRTLDLPSVYQATSARLGHILGLFEEVGELVLRCVSAAVVQPEDVEDGLGVAADGEKTCCRSLVVDGRYLVSFTVVHALTFAGLAELEVKFPRPKDMKTLLAVLLAAADRLESLTLHVYSNSAISDIQAGSAPIHLLPVALLLSYLPPTLSDIELKLDESWWSIEDLAHLGWARLEGELVRFGSLRSVTVVLYPRRPEGDVDMAKIAKDEMPTLAERGILR